MSIATDVFQGEDGALLEVFPPDEGFKKVEFVCRSRQGLSIIPFDLQGLIDLNEILVQYIDDMTFFEDLEAVK